MNELIKELREWWDNAPARIEISKDLPEIDLWRLKLIEILSHHEAKAEEGLRERLIKIQNYTATCMERRDEPEFSMFSEIAGELSALLKELGPIPAKTEEPLAVLADRKGYDIQVTGPSFGQIRTGGIWVIGITNLYPKCEEFVGPTYAAAESAARKYLEGLPDKGESK